MLYLNKSQKCSYCIFGHLSMTCNLTVLAWRLSPIDDSSIALRIVGQSSDREACWFAYGKIWQCGTYWNSWMDSWTQILWHSKWNDIMGTGTQGESFSHTCVMIARLSLVNLCLERVSTDSWNQEQFWMYHCSPVLSCVTKGVHSKTISALSLFLCSYFLFLSPSLLLSCPASLSPFSLNSPLLSSHQYAFIFHSTTITVILCPCPSSLRNQSHSSYHGPPYLWCWH